MSWINSNATYKQNSKNDLSFYHGFSKTPVEPSSTGTAATTLANASTKGGHTVIGTEVWAEEIPWFGLVPSRAVAVTRLSGLTKLNDLVKVDGEGGKVYKYIGADDATFTEAQWSSFWQEVTLTNGMTLNNRHNQPVLRYYLNQPMQTLTTTNNASIDSKGYATRLFVNETDHTGQTSGGSVVSQFAAGTDNIKNGIPSVELNPKLYLGTTEKIAGTHYYDYNVSGTILWSTAVTSSSPKISCFRYIGKTVTGQLATVESALSAHTADISDIKLALGLEDTNPDGTQSVTARVETVEDVVRVLLGLGSDATITATESIATTAANVVSTSLSGTTEGTIGKAIADAKQEALNAINAIQHFSVVVVPQGQTMENVTPVENTIYLVSDTNAADGSYIEYIAFKQGETVVTEKIGSTKIDLSGYATVTTVNGIDTRLQTAEGQIATITSTDATKEGSIAKALADAKTYAEGQAATAKSGAETTAANALSAARTEITAEIAQAKSEAIASAEVTITAGTGIVVTGEGKGTTFEISVSDDVATAASVSALSQVVASNKTELEGKITAASTALETAKTEIKGTTDALDGRLQTAEGKVSTLEGQVATLTTGDNSVAKQIETAANAIKGQSLAQTGTLTGMFSVQTAGTVGTGITGITITDAGLANAISDAKKAGTDAAAAVETLKTTSVNYSTSLGSDANVVTVALGGTVGAPRVQLTNVAAASALTALENKVNAYHEAGVSYKVHNSQTLPDLSVAENVENYKNVILLVPSLSDGTESGDETEAITGGYVEWLCVNKGTKEAPSWDWEQIGTTAADLHGYVNWIEPGGATTLANQGSIYADISSKGYLTLGVASATDSVMGVSKLFSGNYWELPSTVTDTAVSTLTASAMFSNIDDKLATKADADEVVNSINGIKGAVNLCVHNYSGHDNSVEGDVAPSSDPTNHANLWGMTFISPSGSSYVKLVDDFVGMSKSYLTTANLPSDAASVENNFVMNADGHVITTIRPERMVSGFSTYNAKGTLKSFVGDLSNLESADLDGNAVATFYHCSALTSFVGDLSSLTNGSRMFESCNDLATFTSDLSSLTNGNMMFYETNLSLESVECIADTINTHEGQIRIDWSQLPDESERQAIVDELSRIVDKGWTLDTNHELLPLFDSEKYETGYQTVQPLDLESEPQTVYYVRKK